PGASPGEQTPPKAELERRLAVVAKERSQLLQRQADLIAASRQPASDGSGLRQETAVAGLEPIVVFLVKNRVVPFKTPYFSGRRVQVRNSSTGRVGPGVAIDRVSDGASVDDARRAGGTLDEMMRGADPKKKYFHIEVCADSIAAFDAVSELVS